MLHAIKWLAERYRAPLYAQMVSLVAIPTLLAVAGPAILICPDLPTVPKIDGDLSDKAWTPALAIRDFRDKASDEPAPAPTKILLGRHGETLYLAAQLSFRAGHNIASFSKSDDDPDLWRDDCLEVFVAPTLNKPDFLQIILNSAGQIADSCSGGAWDLSPRPQLATRIANGQLQMEASFRLAALAGKEPREGDVWGLKLCRTHWDRQTKDRAKENVYTSDMPGSGSYSSRPYARLVFGRVTEVTRKALAKLAPKTQGAHPIHQLIEAAKTKVWAKPYRKLFRNRRHQSERLIFHDTDTGAEIWRVTCDPHNDGVTYANRFPWNADGSCLMFMSRGRMGGNWHMFMTGDGEHVMQIPGTAQLAHPRWRRGHPDELLSAAGKSLVSFDIRTGEQQVIAQIPEDVPGRATFGPHGRWTAVCKQGFGEGGILTVIDVQTGESRRIKLRTSSEDFSGDWLYSGGIAYVKGVPHVGYSLNHLPHLSREHQYQQWLMNLETGEYRSVRYLSHGGTSPLGDRKVGYWGGGVHTTDYFGDDKEFVMNIGTGGHIAWMSSPEWCVAGNSGSPGGSRFSGQLVQIYVDTGNWCRIAHGQTKNTTYASHLFCNTSPDGTKVEYSSTMLGRRDMYWAVMHRPEPPRNLKGTRNGQSVRLEWERPAIGKECAGARIWRARQSGGPYGIVSGNEPVAGQSWTDADAPTPAYYVATSVEHSSLESRCFSSEVAPTDGQGEWPGRLRLYVEAETGQGSGAFDADFHGSASCDRFIEHRQGTGAGQLTLEFDLTKGGRFQVWARMRATANAATVVAKLGSQSASATVTGPDWRWTRLDPRADLGQGQITIVLKCSEPGIGIDKLLLTDDLEMEPTGFGDTEQPPVPRIAYLTAAAESPYEVRLEWQAGASPSIHHFNIYRIRRPGAAISQESLVASPSTPAHLDWGLDPGTAFEYVVTTVDCFGHESEAARVTCATPGVERRLIQVEAETGEVEGGELRVVEDPVASGGAYVETSPEELRSPYRLIVPFEVAEPGDYVVWASMFPLKDSHIYQRFAVDGKPKGLMYLGSQRSGSTKRLLLWRPLGVVTGVTPFVWHLEPGPHRIEILHVGQPGFVKRYHAIDQFIVTNDRSFVPAGPTWEWE